MRQRKVMPKLVRFGVACAIGAVRTLPAAAQSPTQSAGPRLEQNVDARLADSLFAAHAYQRAFALYDRLTRTDSTVLRYWNQLGYSAALIQDYAAGTRAFAHATLLGGGPPAAYNTGAMHARLGHADSAFAWLQRAVRAGFSDTTTLATDEDLASLRGDPRYAQLGVAIRNVPMPCQTDPEFRRFDFWVGQWKVFNTAGVHVGNSHVDVVSSGCALLENWEDLRGVAGKSLNTFDRASGQWRQFWVGQALTDYARSEWHGSTLMFFADVAAVPGTPKTKMRLSFTPVEKDVVRQFGEISTDDGRTWTFGYDFLYRRAP